MTTIKPTTTTEVIYQGDDIAKLEALDERVAAAEDAVKRAKRATGGRPRLVSEGDPLLDAEAHLDAVKQERDAFAAEAEPRGVKVAMESVGRRVWRKLVAEHPARREGGQIIPQDYQGVNVETFPDALLAVSIVREESTIEGDLSEFLDSLRDADFERLYMAAFTINRGKAGADPTQRVASATR